jgi:hypothetical protein
MTFAEDGDDSDDDDDLEMGGATQNYNCPISLTILVNPVTSYAQSIFVFSHFDTFYFSSGAFAATVSLKVLS